ncbi:regulatory protein RecX [Lutispora thermophila]|uniref:Regulatory protein RecX n=1 Tax=Lutispora thermophila DSM 19022 TaxID=1122184 RepID=A0A1M6I679_9FIRM|nr:regulatory protein RecX [Lutispora thermophila]SHJ29921.1 SOS response regulatory protein OraA/RecX, interacts with RecA [Lutispora thermophila DSM 19022]
MDLKEAYNYCIKLLSIKDRTSQEIITKLKQKNCSEEIIQEALSKLMDYGYINDEKYLENWIRENLKKPGMSKRSMYYKLLHKGLNKDLLDSEFEKIEIDDYNTAFVCAEKKIKLLMGEDVNIKKKKLFTYLLSKGYSRDICSKVITELLGEDETYL